MGRSPGAVEVGTVEIGAALPRVHRRWGIEGHRRHRRHAWRRIRQPRVPVMHGGLRPAKLARCRHGPMIGERGLVARPGREGHACQRGIRYRVPTVGWEKGGRAWLLDPVVAATAPAAVMLVLVLVLVLVLILVVARRTRKWPRGVLELGPRVDRNGELRRHLATLGLVWPLPRSLGLARGLLMAWTACRAWIAWGRRARRVSVDVILRGMRGRRWLMVAVLRLLRVAEDEIAQSVLEGALSGLAVGCHSDGVKLAESGFCLGSRVSTSDAAKPTTGGSLRSNGEVQFVVLRLVLCTELKLLVDGRWTPGNAWSRAS